MVRNLGRTQLKNVISCKNQILYELTIFPKHMHNFQIVGESSAVYLGQYVMLLGVLDAALCGTYYTVVFLRKKQHKQIHISVPSTCT